MRIPPGDDGATALALVSTIRHDGHGGVADDFAEDAAVVDWVRVRWPGPAAASSQGLPDSMRLLRRAARALFAMSVRPAPPSRADTARTMADSTALGILNDAVDALDLEVGAEIRDDRLVPVRTTARTDPDTVVRGLVALACMDFLTGPAAPKLRSCQAPRCVRYFIQAHGRQEWCKESCGNRARAARFRARRKPV
ncbi:CGNR zinc finger domain-containing protein [Jiangella asiatica]|uniref:CGNR zinc finger domain-containing protein n=1 Tax=Jiangella asiatica TaxID=2530372 RepID=UPI00193DA5FD|nr:CGNR zinc finger domain-containing protein [Jiangella asiatica]